MLRIQIIKDKKDIDVVAKVVIIDENNDVLFLRRSDYHKKFAGELDLPGGHLKEGENLISGLKREVLEETGLKIKNPVFFEKQKDRYYFFAKYNNKKIKLSDEHIEYGFYNKSELDQSKKFEKIAIKVLEKLEND